MAEERTLGGDGFERCETCGGTWMEADHFLAVLREAQPRLALDELPEQYDGTPRRPCPQCGERMAIVWLEFLQLDQCAEHGVWFDGGELDKALRGDTRPRDVVWLQPRKTRR
jgi:Zn-finger nucleic acid-binding protein